MEQRNVTSTIQCDGGGYHVLWYCDETEEESRWYGSRDACMKRAQQPAPEDTDAWVPVRSEGSPPYDAATATGMYDHD